MKLKNKYQKHVFDNKTIPAILFLSFVMLSVAYYAHAQTVVVSADAVEATYRRQTGEHWCIDGKCTDVSSGIAKAVNDATPSTLDAPKAIKPTAYVRKSRNADIENIIRAEARKQGYTDVELALDIAACESRFNPQAKNVNRDKSIDLGLWQINQYWHKIGADCSLDAQCSTEYAVGLLKQGKAHLWVCYNIVNR